MNDPRQAPVGELLATIADPSKLRGLERPVSYTHLTLPTKA